MCFEQRGTGVHGMGIVGRNVSQGCCALTQGCGKGFPASSGHHRVRGGGSQQAEQTKRLKESSPWGEGYDELGCQCQKGLFTYILEVNTCTKKPQKCLGMERESEVWAGGNKAPISSWYAAHGWGLTLFKHNLLSLSEWNQGSVLHLS